MRKADDDLLIKEINELAEKAAKLLPRHIDISLYAAMYAKHFDREEADIKEQIRVIFRAKGLFWDGDGK